MPSLDECQNRIDVYTNAGDWLRNTIRNLGDLSDNLERMKNIVESDCKINGNPPEIVNRIQDLKARVDDIRRWNKDEILMHIDNERSIGVQYYDAEQARLEQE
jgi:hypothetical protein